MSPSVSMAIHDEHNWRLLIFNCYFCFLANKLLYTCSSKLLYITRMSSEGAWKHKHQIRSRAKMMRAPNAARSESGDTTEHWGLQSGGEVICECRPNLQLFEEGMRGHEGIQGWSQHWSRARNYTEDIQVTSCSCEQVLVKQNCVSKICSYTIVQLCHVCMQQNSCLYVVFLLLRKFVFKCQ